MRILIIEDEHYASKRLKKLLESEISDLNILSVIDTVTESVEWFSSHVEPDLVFMDIQLADGLSFQIFDKIKINCPVIFTTAYDEYALNAFKVNSIDYLLKPLDPLDLKGALEKYQSIYPNHAISNFDWKNISKEILKPKESFKQRFLIKSGSAYAYLKTSDIEIIHSEDGLSFAYDSSGKKVLLDYSLDRIIKHLDPTSFFRISRKHIISLTYISKVHPYLNSRLKLDNKYNIDDEIIVSRDRVKDFKHWLDS